MSKKKEAVVSREVLAVYALWISRNIPEIYKAGCVFALLESKKFPEESSLAEYVISLTSVVEGDPTPEFGEYVKFEKEKLKGVKFPSEKKLWEWSKKVLGEDFYTFKKYNIFPLLLKMFNEKSFSGTEVEALFVAMEKYPLEPLNHEDLAGIQLELAEEKNES